MFSLNLMRETDKSRLWKLQNNWLRLFKCQCHKKDQKKKKKKSRETFYIKGNKAMTSSA